MENIKLNSHGEKTRGPALSTQRVHQSLIKRHHYMVDQQLNLVSFRSRTYSGMALPTEVALSCLAYRLLLQEKVQLQTQIAWMKQTLPRCSVRLKVSPQHKQEETQRLQSQQQKMKKKKTFRSKLEESVADILDKVVLSMSMRHIRLLIPYSTTTILISSQSTV